MKLILLSLALVFGVVGCAVQEERKPVLIESEESELPWNRMQEGEGQGLLGGFQRR
ncbi:MAG: hypothetical protein AAGC74_09525 [Verrucomicrobiota bacterium]